MIFVFGSNLDGRHGAGAGLYARKNHGAVPGVGVGRQGNSYALPTKGHHQRRREQDEVLPTLTLEQIAGHAGKFVEYAVAHPELQFQLTAVGCGLAGFRNEQISPLFATAPSNVLLPPEWRYLWPDLPEFRFWQYPPA